VENNILYFVEECEKLHEVALFFPWVVHWFLIFMCLRTPSMKMEQTGCSET